MKNSKSSSFYPSVLNPNKHKFIINSPDKTTSQHTNTNKLVSLGYLDLEFTLVLTEIDIKLFKIEYEILTSLEGVKMFFESQSAFLDRVIISSKNNLITTLLYLNKTQNKKTFIEYLTLNKLVYSEEELFMKEVIKHITQHNFIFIEENEIFDSDPEIIFTIKFPLKEKIVFNIGKKRDVVVGANKVIKEMDYSLMNKLPTDFSHFNYFLLNLNDFMSIHRNKGDTNNQDQGQEEELNYFSVILELLKEININFRNLKVILEFPSIISNSDCINFNRIQSLFDITTYSDLLLFEKKEALAFYKIIYELKDIDHDAENNNIVNINNNKNSDSTLEQFFITEIKFNYKSKSQIKSVIFIDELVTIKICDKNLENIFLFNNNYKFEIYPKINHLNLDLIDQYKKDIHVNYPYLKSIFLGGFLSNYINKKSLC